jgi:predicted dehydrogenase
MTALATKSGLDLPRIGFLGAGRIGLNRMEALVKAGLVEPAMIFDSSPEMTEAAMAIAPGAQRAASYEEMLDAGLDGIVIATPSAMHARQSIAALERGLAVFCQKPLGRTAAEVEAVVCAARKADRALGVDLSYRHTEGMRQIRSLLRSATLGQVFAADLVFHNAYGPDKPWFFDKAQSGGGCVMDLGVHLVDLALWALDFPEVTGVTGHLFSKGQTLEQDGEAIEDFAIATLSLATGTVVRITCSWHLHAGRDAVIGADFHGTEGGASLANVGGSFFDFAACHHVGTSSTSLAEPPDAWWGGAAAAWAKEVSGGGRFDPAAEQYVAVAHVLDRIYAR